jgi:exopolysaccharide biosynthesis polyprenyl glycosylphosphotransferase
MIAKMERERCGVLQVSDLLAFVVSCTLVEWIDLLRAVVHMSYASPQTQSVPLVMAGVAVLWSMSLGLVGAYHYPVRFRQEFFALLRGGILSFVVVLALAPVGWSSIPRRAFLALIFLAVLLALVFRFLMVPALLRLAGRRKHLRVLIAGNSATAEYVANLFRSRNGYELKHSKAALRPDDASRNGGSTEAFQADLKMYQPAEVIFVKDQDSPVGLRQLVQACQAAGIPWQFVPDFEHLGVPNLQTHVVGGLPLITTKGSAFNGVNLRIKQLIDVVLGVLLLILAAPIMLVVWIMIRLDSEGPAIIVQPRLGYKGKVFNIYKFRTMYQNADDTAHRTYIKQCIKGEPYGEGTEVRAKQFKIANDKRVTRVGALLRRYSLDELPQIFNVLKLEMSLVGPRPSLAYELESYQDWHKERLEAIPGLTGLWQISGRSLLSFNDMVRLDLEYLRNWTPIQDFRLLVKTIPAIFRGTGV